MRYQALENNLPDRGTGRYRSLNHILPIHQACGTKMWTTCWKAVDMFYRTVDHILPGPELNSTVPQIMWYRAADHMLAGRATFNFRAVDHELPSRGPYSNRPSNIRYRAVTHVLPVEPRLSSHGP